MTVAFLRFRVFAVNSSGCSVPTECPDYVRLEEEISPDQVIVGKIP